MIEGWLGGAAVIGVVAACWNKIKLFSWRIVNLLIVRARLEGSVSEAFGYYCWNKLKRSPFGENRYDGFGEFVVPADRYLQIGYETIGTDPRIFWQGWRPILVSFGSGNENFNKNFGYAVTISFFRGTFNLDNLLISCLDRLNNVRHSGNGETRHRVKKVFGSGRRVQWQREEQSRVEPSEGVLSKGNNNYDRRYLKWKLEDIGRQGRPENPFSGLVYPAEVLEVVQRCSRWLNSEKWYKGKDIPWRLGVLLTGIPGTGKTSLVRAIACELDLPVISYDLASFSNQEFEARWQDMLNTTPCIALLEDVDTVFDGRENRLGENGGGLTFDCLLNCIGGVKDANGVLVFITTNRPEYLDSALGKQDNERGVSTRPGRIDLVVELQSLDIECRTRLAQRLLEDCTQEVDRLVVEGDGDSGAQFVERCAKVALEHYWTAEKCNGHIENRVFVFSNKGDE